jgi:hypothetical protein
MLEYCQIMTDCESRNVDGPANKSGLLARIKYVGLANFAAGMCQMATGWMTGNSTLTTAALHDIVGGGIYGVRHNAAQETDERSRLMKRAAGALGLIGAAGAFDGVEISRSLAEQGHANLPAFGVAAGALVVNLFAGAMMYKHRGEVDARDSWQQITRADLPGAMATLACTGAAMRYPAADVAGAVFNTGLAVNVGVQALRDIWRGSGGIKNLLSRRRDHRSGSVV